MRKAIILSCVLTFTVATAFYADGYGHANESRKISFTSSAKAIINGTSEDLAINGVVKFHAIKDGVRVMAKIKGATPGKHGIHIHQLGSCEEGGKSAGGHYNPFGNEHGFLPDDGVESAHLGDMGNIIIDENGEGTLNIDLPGLSIMGEAGILGRSVILHAKEDDFGQPTGNAGGRQACGIIGAAKAWDSEIKATMKANKDEIMKKEQKESN